MRVKAGFAIKREGHLEGYKKNIMKQNFNLFLYFDSVNEYVISELFLVNYLLFSFSNIFSIK